MTKVLLQPDNGILVHTLKPTVNSLLAPEPCAKQSLAAGYSPNGRRTTAWGRGFGSAESKSTLSMASAGMKEQFGVYKLLVHSSTHYIV